MRRNSPYSITAPAALMVLTSTSSAVHDTPVTFHTAAAAPYM